MKDASPSLRADDPPMTLGEATAICLRPEDADPAVWRIADQVVRIVAGNANGRVQAQLKARNP
jgi:hypothetical protein